MVYGRLYADGKIQPNKSFTVRDTNEKVVGDVSTDGSGNYSIFLPPGTYSIEYKDSNNTMWRAQIDSYPQPVRQDIYLTKK